MGWLSLATKVVPKLWRGTVGATSTLWRGGGNVMGAGAKILSAASRNPKNTVAAGVATYAGWKVLNNPEMSMGTAVGKTVREGVEGMGSFSHDAVNGFTGEQTVEEVKDTTTSVITDLKDGVKETKGILGTLGDALQGITSFLRNIFGGEGTNMFANFFNNIGNGNVSGLGIGALIAAGYMIFGRTGLLGKIGGALVAMMMIGGNSQRQERSQTQEVAQGLSQEQQRGMHR